jgi:calcium-dependent protein kinase
MTFIVCQLTTKEEQAELYKSFKALDKNSDGKLSIDELIEGYKDIYKHLSEEEIKKEAERVFKLADSDGSGEIDYSEWQVATINKLDILSDNKLKGAFDLFDRVNNYTLQRYRTKVEQYQHLK